MVAITANPAIPTTFAVTSPTASFAFDWPWWDADDVIVRVDGVALDPSAYTVDGSGDGGIVTLNASVDDVTVEIDRLVRGDLTAGLSTTGPLNIDALNSQLARLTARGQDLSRIIAAIAPITVEMTGTGGDFLRPEDITAGCDDGVTDASNAIEALGSSPAYFSGAYKITRQLTITAAPNWTFGPGAYIDASALTGSQIALTVTGAVGSPILLTSNTLKDSAAVVLASVSGIGAGGLVKLYSDGVFDPARTLSKVGELAYVKSVSSLTATLVTKANDDYKTADSAAVRAITPLTGVNIQGLTVLGAEGSSKFLQGLQLRACVEPRVTGASFFNCSGRGIEISDCMGGRTETLLTRITDPTNTGYGVVFAHATRGHVVSGHTSVLMRHPTTTANSNTAGFEGIPRDNVYENAVVFGTQTSLALAGGDGLDTHAATDGHTFRNCTLYDVSGKGINIESPTVTCENIRMFRCGSHAISAFNITSKPGAYVFRNIEIDGCLRVINAEEGFNSATGAVTRLTIDGLRAKNFTQNAILGQSLFTTPEMVWDVRGLDLDCAACASTPIIDIEQAAVWKSGPVRLINVAPAANSIDIEAVPIVRFDSLPTVLFATTVAGTPTNSSGICVLINPGTATTISGDIGVNCQATATNTAQGVRLGANVRGTLRVRDVQGNPNTRYTAVAGAVAIPPHGHPFATAARPTPPVDCHCMIWDTTLGKPVWEDATASATDWTDATGADA